MTDPATDAHTQQPSLKGRRAVITGGTTGIGRAIAVLLASYGVKVFICGRNPDHLADALVRIREVGEGEGISIDLATPDGISGFFEAADGYLGGLDIAVMNAAVPVDGIADVGEGTAQYAIAADFTAYLLGAQAAVKRMAAGSDIVFIGSMAAVSRNAGSIYVAAKAGVEAFAQSLRQELAGKNIKVGNVEPGFTGADFQYPEFPPDKQAAMIHAEEMLRAEDVAVAVHFMLSQPRRSSVSLIRVEPRLHHK